MHFLHIFGSQFDQKRTVWTILVPVLGVQHALAGRWGANTGKCCKTMGSGHSLPPPAPLAKIRGRAYLF